MLGCCCHGITVNHSSPNSSHTLTLADPFSWNWQNVWEKREWGQRQGWCVGSTFYLNHFHWKDLALFLGPSAVKLIKAGMWIMGCVLQINRLKMHSSVVKQLSRSTDEECYTICVRYVGQLYCGCICTIFHSEEQLNTSLRSLFTAEWVWPDQWDRLSSMWVKHDYWLLMYIKIASTDGKN